MAYQYTFYSFVIVVLTVKKYDSIPWYYITVHTPEKKGKKAYDHKGFSHNIFYFQ